ncbi:MAG: hypothetical protein ACFCU8_11430 [Thermosynechococcaceae cyanobacterium]
MSALNTFNLLALGHRGAGKTVFLAGSYAASRPSRKLTQSWRLWFDCQDISAQKNLEELLSGIARTGRYPPPTMKVTSFRFQLQRRNLWGAETLCQFRWSDIPGEICSFANPYFQAILLRSHGGCLFIDAPSLARHGSTYLETLESLIRQIEVISAHVNHQGIRFPFALILTKCDSLQSLLGQSAPSNSHSVLQLQENLQPLLNRLNRSQAHYQIFYSSIPINASTGMSSLESTRAAMPFLWLTSELRSLYRWQEPKSLAAELEQLFHKTDKVLPDLVSQNVVSQQRLQRSESLYRWFAAGVVALVLAIGVRLISKQEKTPAQQPLNQFPAEQSTSPTSAVDH